jgi:hypothetical protein
MKWIVTLLVVVICTTACQKAPLADNTKQVSGVKGEINNLVGTWKMFQWYSDNGTGTGSWMSAAETESITFGADGSFSSTPNSPYHSYGYDKYVAKGSNVVLTNSIDGFSDAYQYNFESSTQLLMYAKCRENCMRRYQLQ